MKMRTRRAKTKMVMRIRILMVCNLYLPSRKLRNRERTSTGFLTKASQLI